MDPWGSLDPTLRTMDNIKAALLKMHPGKKKKKTCGDGDGSTPWSDKEKRNYFWACCIHNQYQMFIFQANGLKWD